MHTTCAWKHTPITLQQSWYVQKTIRTDGLVMFVMLRRAGGTGTHSIHSVAVLLDGLHCDSSKLAAGNQVRLCDHHVTVIQEDNIMLCRKLSPFT